LLSTTTFPSDVVAVPSALPLDGIELDDPPVDSLPACGDVDEHPAKADMKMTAAPRQITLRLIMGIFSLWRQPMTTLPQGEHDAGHPMVQPQSC
jgi:hypothetical protein